MTLLVLLGPCSNYVAGRSYRKKAKENDGEMEGWLVRGLDPDSGASGLIERTFQPQLGLPAAQRYVIHADEDDVVERDHSFSA